MNKYIDAEKLKAEIDKLESFSCISEEQDGFYSAISRINDIIDSLQHEQLDVDLEKVIEQTYHNASVTDTSDMDLVDYENIARHFYELGQQEMRHRITNPEYNTKVVEQLKSEYPIIKEE